MSLLSLLEVSDTTTDIVKWVSLGTVFLLLGVIAIICFSVKKRTYDAKHIAAAGITIGLSFALSYAKISPLPYGGSITLASFVPVLIYAYVYGIVDGLLAGTIFGLLNFVSGPYILTPFTFILDYLLAFASIGIMGVAKKFTKKQTFNVVLGTVAVFFVRFIFHLISGVIYFMDDAVWVDLPDWAMANAFIYSLIYQLVYIPADCAIAAIVMYILAKTKVLDSLVKIITPKMKKAVTESAEEPAPAESLKTDDDKTE
ncbi:MAG: energy-coupled thiamine transporter ThiT [Clostridia bacterium]|nr:energy-coupled thiamine transporter ThiT [Clostridia bacterium]